MIWIAGFFLLCLYGLMLYLGRKLALARPKVANWVSVVCVAVIVFNLFLFYNPQVEFNLVPYHFYLYVRPWWMPVFLFFLLGLALGLLPQRRKQIAVHVLAATIGFFYLSRIAALGTFDTTKLTGEPVGPSMVCHQTTGFTCGAAAAATLLAQVQVHATEREMAELCGTNSVSGTDVIGVMWGLRDKLAGTPYTVKVVAHADLATLKALRRPAMAVMKLSLFIDHWVVVLHADDQSIRLGDPIGGAVSRDPEEFLKSFRGVLVELVPRNEP